MDVLSLYEEHKNMVYRLALSYLKSRADAEDICQTAFMKLLEHQHTITPGKEKSWLASVTVNLCKNLLKSAAVRQSEPLNEDISFEPRDPIWVVQAVMDLSPTERAAVYLHYFEGYSTAETARILGTSQTAVTTRLGRAHKHLRNRLEAEQYA